MRDVVIGLSSKRRRAASLRVDMVASQRITPIATMRHPTCLKDGIRASGFDDLTLKSSSSREHAENEKLMRLVVDEIIMWRGLVSLMAS